MQFTIAQLELRRALTQAARALPSKTALPVLKHFLLVAEDGRLTVAATDTHIGVIAEAAASVSKPGRITVEGDLFADFVKGLPGDAVIDISFDGKRFAATAGSVRARFGFVTADDFPVMPVETTDPPAISIGGQQLAALIGTVEKFAAKNDSRPVLHGIHVTATGPRLAMQAADGFALAANETALDEPVTSELSVIVPIGAMRHLMALASEQSSPVNLWLTPARSQLVAGLHTARFVSSLIDGRFPDVSQIIPRSFATMAEVDRDDLVRTVRRSKSFAADNNDVMQVDVRDGEIGLTAYAMERGDTDCDLRAETDGPDTTVRLGTTYVGNALAAIDGETVWIGLNGPERAVVFRPDRFAPQTHVIMPMTLPNGGR